MNLLSFSCLLCVTVLLPPATVPADQTDISVTTPVNVAHAGPLSAPFPAPGSSQSPHYTHIQLGQVSYVDGIASHVRQWMAERFDWMVRGTPSPLSWNPQGKWLTYRDYASSYNHSQYWMVKEHALRNGFKYEDYFLHMRLDYGNRQRWTKTAKFGDDQNGVKGIMVHNGSTYSDRTDAAWSITAADVPIGNGTLYIRYPEPFDTIAFELSTARAGGAVMWQYWNGSTWYPLNRGRDETFGLTRSGRIRFSPPKDWLPTVINGSRPAFFIRVVVSNSSVPPVATRIYGDDWLTGGLSRGWALSSATRTTCCGGQYEYDPTPPDGATARFRYHSRVRSFFTSTSDAFMMNCSAQSGGVRLWPRYLSDFAVSELSTGLYNGIMLDNGDTTVAEKITSPPDWRTHMDWVEPYLGEQIAGFKQFHNDVKALYPTAAVGLNSAYRSSIVFESDVALLESFTTSNVGEHNFSGKSVSFDHCSDPVLNPRNTVCIITPHDTHAVDGLDTTTSTWYFWDRGDRRPMMMLAWYYIGANDPIHTALFYNSIGTTYATTDQVYYYEIGSTLVIERPADRSSGSKMITMLDATSFPSSGLVKIGELGEHLTYTSKTGNTLNLSEPIYNSYSAGARVQWVATAHQAERDIPLNNVYRWTNWFPAMAVDVGAPTGPRNTQWVTGSAYGSATGRPIMRRDYTKAVMVLRPAVTNSTAANRSTCSNAVQLGGTFYRLHADGRTNPAPVTSIRLREGEGAVLMKQPTALATEAAEWQKAPCQ